MGALSWPEEALRANIIAQVSLALNRIWTEWYPSRGYSFNITGSPGYDQAYVNGRTVFAVMERLTAELFNTFVQRSGDAEPYFTEYCDGKTVTCPGMKQWGTVDRAREGMNALQILRYYYGNRVQLATTDNIAAIPSSYPGSPLRRGSTGTNVRILQKQLSRIAKDYPSFGKPAVTGTFDEATENSVKKFQKQFSLTADGVVGRATWNKVSFIYVSVKDLAELTSEGETAEGTQSTGGWPGTVLRRGSTGSSVEQVQFWLSDLAQFDSSLVRVTVDGSYSAETERAVRAFQQKQGLTADGAVGQRTWNALYAAWVDAQSDLGGTAWPGTALRRGAAGMEVRLVQFWLRLAADNYSALRTVTVDGSYGAATVSAVEAFQTLFGLTPDGVVGRSTWNKLKEVGLAVANKIVAANVAPGQFTTTTRAGSSGTAVRAVQYYLRRLAAYYSDVPRVAVDGKFGAGTAAAVRRFQRYFGLTADGVVGRTTWQKLYEVYNDIANRLLSSSLRPGEYPGVLRTGSSGTAVRELQFYLYLMSAYESSIPPVSIDGKFGADTERAVRAYQRFAGLTVDGVVGRTTWNSLYGRASQLRSSGPVVTLKRLPYPGTPLTVGSSGNAVLYYALLLQRIAYYFDSVENPPLSDQYTDETAAATCSAQQLLGLEQTGIADADTWTAVEALSLQLAAVSPNPDRDAGQADAYPGRAMKEGSVGPDVGQIEQWLNGRYMRICGEDYVTENFRFGPKETEGVRAVQERADLLVTGTVNEETWAALRAQSCECEEG